MLLLFQSAAHTEPLTQGVALGYAHIGLSARLTALAVIMIIPLYNPLHAMFSLSADTPGAIVPPNYHAYINRHHTFDLSNYFPQFTPDPRTPSLHLQHTG